MPEEGFAKTEQKRRSPEGKSLLSRIKILRPPSKRRRRGRNISREILLLLLLPLPHPISSNSYFSSTSYELSVRSWAKRSLRCCHREIRSDNVDCPQFALSLDHLSNGQSAQSERNTPFGKLFYKTTFFFTNCLIGSFFFTNSCFGFFCKPQSTHKGPKLFVMSLNLVFTFVCVLFCKN